MREIRYYEADDGTEFDTKEECIEYENRFSSIVDKIIFIQDRRILDPKKTSMQYCCDECTAIYVPHEEDIGAISRMFASFHTENPFEDCHHSGLHFYDGGWICLDEEIEKLENQKEFFMNLIGME